MNLFFSLSPRLRPILRKLVLLVLAFASLFLVTGKDGAPGGNLFALLLIYVSSVGAGHMIGYCKQLPPLLGMLLAGFTLRNLPFVGERVGGKVDSGYSSALRLIALVLILSRAGLSMDAKALARLRFLLLRLAMLPCLSEALTVAGLSAWLLDFPVSWAAMLGFVLSAISPAVVVPSLLNLQEQGYGTKTGIPTIVVAAAPLDDVLAIAGFGISLGLATSSSDDSNSWLVYARAPLELIVGVSTGLVCAAIVVVLTPSPVGIRQADVTAMSQGDEAKAVAKDASEGQYQRFFLLLAFAITSAFGLKLATLSGASALSILVLGASAAKGWGSAASKAVAMSMAELWNQLAQPILFGLVGASVDVQALRVELVGVGMVLLLCGGLVRACVVILAVSGREFRVQEKIFVAAAWMPKATVQAAIGGIALDEASNEREKTMGRELLALAVLAILFTAPIGATLISLLGPRLLIRDNVVEDEKPVPAAIVSETQASEKVEERPSMDVDTEVISIPCGPPSEEAVKTTKEEL